MGIDQEDDSVEVDYKGPSRLGRVSGIDARFTSDEPRIPIALVFNDREIGITAAHTNASPFKDFTLRKASENPEEGEHNEMKDGVIESLRLLLNDLFYSRHLKYHREADRTEDEMANSDRVLSSSETGRKPLLPFHYYTLAPVLVTSITKELGITGLRKFVELTEEYSLYEEEQNYIPEPEIVEDDPLILNGIREIAEKTTEELFERLAKYEHADRFTIGFGDGLPTIHYYRVGNVENGNDWTLPLETAYSLISILNDFPMARINGLVDIVVLELHDYQLSVFNEGYLSQLGNELEAFGVNIHNLVLLPMSGIVKVENQETVMQAAVSQCLGTIWHEIFHLVASRLPARLHIGTEEGISTSYECDFNQEWLIKRLSKYIRATDNFIPHLNYLFGCDITEVLTEMERSFPEFNAPEFLFGLIDKIEGKLLEKE